MVCFRPHDVRPPPRAQRMEVLRGPAAGRSPAGACLVGACWCCAACCPPPSRWPWACWSARCSAAIRLSGPLASSAPSSCCCRSLAPIHQAISANLGDRTAAWLYDRLTDACVRPPGMGHLEDPTLDERPDRGARLRSRHDRPAAVDLDGLHRRRPGRDDRRPRVAPSCCSRTRGGRRSSWAAPGWRRTGCCARARSGATATPRRCAARSATPTTPIGSRSIPPPAKELRLFGLADWTHRSLRRAGARSCTRCSTRRRGCASSRCCGACCSSSAANVARVLVARRRPRLAAALTLAEVVVFAQSADRRRR